MKSSVNILHLSISEVAGVPYRLNKMFNLMGHRSRAIAMKQELFPADIVNPPWSVLKQHIADADVVHVHGLSCYGLFQAELCDKVFIVHIHGLPDREIAFRPDFPHLISTPDLFADYPSATYIPNLVLFDDLPKSSPIGDGPLRIFKSPSFHDKHHQLFASLVAPIVARLPSRVEYVAPTSPMRYDQICQLRATCHMSLDHLYGYYGLESLESLAQGLVAVNAFSENGQALLENIIGSVPPFAIAKSVQDAGDLLLDLVELALSQPAKFERRRSIGAYYMQQNYKAEKLASLVIDYYRQVIGGLTDEAKTKKFSAVRVAPVTSSPHPTSPATL